MSTTLEAPTPLAARKPPADPRLTALRKAIENILDMRQKWAEAAGHQPPGREFNEALVRLVVEFSAGPVPQVLMPILGAVEDIGECYLREIESGYFRAADYMPTTGTLNALDSIAARVAKLDEPPKPPRVEPLKELFVANVPDHQVALIHGLDVYTVQEYRRDLAKIPQGYVPPRIANWEKDREKELWEEVKSWSNGFILSIVGAKLRAQLPAVLYSPS